MPLAFTVSTRLRLAVALGVLVWCVYRAAADPVTAREAVLYDHLVRLPLREAIVQPDAWGGFGYGVLARRATGLLRLSEFSLRLPSLLAAVLFFWAAFRITRRFPIGFVLLCLYPAGTRTFTRADGFGLALAFWLAAAALLIEELQTGERDGRRNLNLAGLLLGLTVAADPGFLLPALVLAIGFAAVLRSWWLWAERLAATATVTAFVLLFLPAVHARPVQVTDLVEPVTARSAADALRADAGTRPVRIRVDSPLAPYIAFYRAKHRIRTWEIVAGTGPDPAYFVSLHEIRGLPVVHSGPVLVYRSNAATIGGFQPPAESQQSR